MAPTLTETGIDPHALWKAMGSLDSINERIQGSVLGGNESFGLRKLANAKTLLNLTKAIYTHDLTPLAEDSAVQGAARDIALGRYQSMPARDVQIQAAFSDPDVRPDLVRFWPGASSSIPDLFGNYIRQPSRNMAWGNSLLRPLPAAAFLSKPDPDKDTQ